MNEMLWKIGQEAVTSLRETTLDGVEQWETQDCLYVQFVFRVPEIVNAGRLLLIEVIIYPEERQNPAFDLIAHVQKALAEMIEFCVRVERPQWAR